MYSLICTGLLVRFIKKKKKKRCQFPSRLHQSQDLSSGDQCQCICEEDTETEGSERYWWWQWTSPHRHIPVSGRKLHGVKVETWPVANIQVRRLQFLCSDGSRNLRTYCCSVPPFLTLLRPLLPPVCLPIPLSFSWDM